MKLNVVVARTPEEQALGLSEWEDMRGFDAMLFPLDPPRPVAIGFDRMRFAIDVLFLDADGKIEVMHPGVPAKGKAISTTASCGIVAELAAGSIAKLGLQPGMRIADWKVFFDPSEARDDHGRWTASGDSGSTAAPGLGEVGIDGLSVELGRGGIYVAKVGEKEIGHVTVSASHPFIESSGIDAAYQRHGLASAIYDIIEKNIGRRLVPSPLGLTQSATAFWHQRLSTMPVPEANALVDEAVKIGLGYGISQQHLSDRLDSLRRAAKFFDPSEARLPAGGPGGGQWTRDGSGGAMGAVSPNVAEGLSFGDAVISLGGERHAKMRQAFDEVDKAIGIPAHMQDAIGAWADGAENSMVVDFAKDAPWEAVKADMALKGYFADQKAVLAFQPDDNGTEYLYHVSVPSTDLGAIHADLLNRGIEFHTLVPSHTGTDVLVYDAPGALGDKVNSFRSDNHGTGGFHTGKGEFIGDWNDRAVARTAYVREIEAFAGSGNAPAEFGPWWAANRDRRYQAALGQVVIAWFFNVDQPRDPAGSSTGGQWISDGGGGDVSEPLGMADLPITSSVRGAKDWSSTKDMEEFRSLTAVQLDDLSSDEQEALKDYTGTYYHMINDYARDGEIDPSDFSSDETVSYSDAEENIENTQGSKEDFIAVPPDLQAKIDAQQAVLDAAMTTGGVKDEDQTKLDDLMNEAENHVDERTAAWEEMVKNEQQRLAKLDLETRASDEIDRLDNAFKEATLPVAAKVYRTFSTNHLGVPADELVGATLTDAGFVSTTINPSAVFAVSGNRMVAEINLPAGAKAIYVDPISNNEGEKEVLIARDSTFKVIGLTYSDRYATKVLVMDYVPPTA